MTLIGNGNVATALSTELECVLEQVLYEGETISGNFVAIDHDIFWSSDHPGIDFTATAPGGSNVLSLKGASGDKFDFKAPKSGIYKFCFRNPASTPETVSFCIHVGDVPNEHELAKDANVSTNKRVIYFTLAEYLVFVGASALQVLYIRNLFSKSVAYNRV